MPKKNKWLLAAGAAIVLTIGQTVPPVYADDTGVHVYVDGPQLALADVAPSGVTISSTPFSLTGTIRKLNQIRVYIDGRFAEIIPLDQSATTFQYSLTVSPGKHTVELIGVGDNGPIAPVSFIIVYQPTLTPLPGGQPHSSEPSQSEAGVTIGPGLHKSTTGLIPFSSWPGFGVVYSALVFLDIVKPDGGLQDGFLRFLLLLAAFLLLFFAQIVLAAYRKVRYGWLGWRRYPLPAVVRRHPLALLRLAGIAVIIAVICLV